jgi:hypothetical protein
MRAKCPAAVALGKLAAGKPKRFSAAEIARRTARIQKYNAERKKVAAVGAKTSCPKRKKSNEEIVKE